MRKASSSQSLTKMRRTVGNALTPVYPRGNWNNGKHKSEPSADQQGEEGGKNKHGRQAPQSGPQGQESDATFIRSSSTRPSPPPK